jgi:hypothetical protein
MKSSIPLLLQAPGSFEVRAVVAHALAKDIPIVRATADMDSLCGAFSHHEDLLPIGSVEFVRAAMFAAGIEEPPPCPYPDALIAWRKRPITRMSKEAAVRYASITDVFVKPADQVKLFTGFVLSKGSAKDKGSAEDAETLATLPDDTPLYVSPPVTFLSEWRCYVSGQNLVGIARYDDQEADGRAPNMAAVWEMVHDYALDEDAPSAYALDVGVLSDGGTALVEVNDAWALGLYRGMDDIASYLAMLQSRWSQLRNKPTTPKWRGRMVPSQGRSIFSC